MSETIRVPGIVQMQCDIKNAIGEYVRQRDYTLAKKLSEYDRSCSNILMNYQDAAYKKRSREFAENREQKEENFRQETLETLLKIKYMLLTVGIDVDEYKEKGLI